MWRARAVDLAPPLALCATQQLRTRKSARPRTSASGMAPWWRESWESSQLSPSIHTCPCGTCTVASARLRGADAPGVREGGALAPSAACHGRWATSRPKRAQPGFPVSTRANGACITCKGGTQGMARVPQGRAARTTPQTRFATTLPPESGLEQTTTSPIWRSLFQMRRAALFTKRMSPERTEGSMLGPAHCDMAARGAGAQHEARLAVVCDGFACCARSTHHNDASAEVGDEETRRARFQHHHGPHVAEALGTLGKELWQALSERVARPSRRHGRCKATAAGWQCILWSILLPAQLHH